MTAEQQLAERNKAVVRRWIEEFKTGGDESVADELRAPHFVNHSAPPGAPTGPEAGKLAFRAMRAAFPDLHVRIDDMLAEGDRVVTRQTFSGTHHGEWSGVPATGRRVSWAVIDIVRLEDGRLVDHWAVADLHGLLGQLSGEDPR
ncbi:MAG TPA: ester cyclase [Blastococcus sp.]|nr:ester cyclase [Blastococcus sp.]